MSVSTLFFGQKLIHMQTFSAVWEPKRTFFAPILRQQNPNMRFFEVFTGLKFASKNMMQKFKVFTSRVLSNLSNRKQIFIKISNENRKVCM